MILLEKCRHISNPTLHHSGSTRLPPCHCPCGHSCFAHLPAWPRLSAPAPPPSLVLPPPANKFNRQKGITTYMAGCKTLKSVFIFFTPHPSGDHSHQLFAKWHYNPTRLNGGWSLFTIFYGISISSLAWTSKKTSSLWHACCSNRLEA